MKMKQTENSLEQELVKTDQVGIYFLVKILKLILQRIISIGKAKSMLTFLMDMSEKLFNHF